MTQQRGRGRFKGSGSKSSDRLNTIGMSERELDSLLGELDTPTSATAKRVYSRWRYRIPNLTMLLRHSSGTNLSMHVACRNLSCGGSAVLHNAYVHLGTHCTLGLPRRGAALVPVTGKVVRCDHRQGIVHELGIRFDQPIRVRDFCGTGPLVDRFSFERVDPVKLIGTALVVSDSELQHRMLRHFLGETQISLRIVRSCAAALDENIGSVDIVIVDWKLPDAQGNSLLMDLRSIGCSAPVIVAVPSTMDVSGHHDGFAPEAYLHLPLKQDDVLRALAEFLLIPQCPEEALAGGGPRPEDPHAALRDAVTSLTIAINACDGIGCYSVCMSLREIAESTSLGQVSVLASQAALALGESLDLNAAKPQLEALLAACNGIGGKSIRTA